MLLRDFIIQRQVPEWRRLSTPVKHELLEAARRSSYADRRANARLVVACLGSMIALFLLLSVFPFYYFERSMPAGVGAALTAVLTLLVASVVRTRQMVAAVKVQLREKPPGGDRR